MKKVKSMVILGVLVLASLFFMTSTANAYSEIFNVDNVYMNFKAGDGLKFTGTTTATDYTIKDEAWCEDGGKCYYKSNPDSNFKFQKNKKYTYMVEFQPTTNTQNNTENEELFVWTNAGLTVDGHEIEAYSCSNGNSVRFLDVYEITVDENGTKIQDRVIDEIKIDNINLDFKVNDKLDTDKFVIYDGIKYSASISWKNKAGNKIASAMGSLEDDVESFDTFEEDVYYATISIILHSSSGYKFSDDTKVYINGEKIDTVINYNNTSLVLKNFKILDFASKTEEEKSQVLLETEFTKLVDSITSENDVKGMTDELYNKIKDAQNNNGTVNIEVKTDEIKTIANQDNINKKIKDKLVDFKKVASYLDITLPVTINGEKEGFVSELNSNIKITVKIPTTIPKLKENLKRIYTVVRIHNNNGVEEIEELETQVNSDGTITFETNKFSDYIILYQDLNSANQPVDSTNISVPNTLDNVASYMIMAIVSLSIMLLIAFKCKKLGYKK